MSNTLAIAKRELMSFFYSPIAYVVMCVFLLLSGFFFMRLSFDSGAPASLRIVFQAIVWLLIFIGPAISMRLLSDELRAGTIETLMTSPVSDAQVVIGKWLGAMMFYAVMLAPTLIYVILLAVWADPDYGPIFTGYLGLLLVGSFYLAIGAFASVLTRNQIVAFLVSVFVLFPFTIITWYLPDRMPTRIAAAMYYVNVNTQFDDFSKGVIDLRPMLFFVSGTVLFLTLGVKALESRKWR